MVRMDDNSASTASSKAAKKNKKRNAKKSGDKSGEACSQGLDTQSMLIELKKMLEVAKASKDHALIATLRNEIYVLTDVIHGVKTQIPEEDLEELLTSIHSRFNAKTGEQSTTHGCVEEHSNARSVDRVANTCTDSSTVVTSLTDDRKLRNLRKKLEQILVLKERQKRGEKLEANQVEKINSELQLLEEIKELEDIIKSIQIKS